MVIQHNNKDAVTQIIGLRGWCSWLYNCGGDNDDDNDNDDNDDVHDADDGDRHCNKAISASPGISYNQRARGGYDEILLPW